MRFYIWFPIFLLSICNSTYSQSCKYTLNTVIELYNDFDYKDIPNLIQGCLNSDSKFNKDQASFIYINSLLANKDSLKLNEIGIDRLLNIVSEINISQLNSFHRVDGFDYLLKRVEERRVRRECGKRVKDIISYWEEFLEDSLKHDYRSYRRDTIVQARVEYLFERINICGKSCISPWNLYRPPLSIENLDSLRLTDKEFNTLYEIALEIKLLRRKRNSANLFKHSLKKDKNFILDSAIHTNRFLKFYSRKNIVSPDSKVRLFKKDYSFKPKVGIIYGDLASQYTFNPGFEIGLQTNLLSFGPEQGNPVVPSGESVNSLNTKSIDHLFNVNAGISFIHLSRRYVSRGVRYRDTDSWFNAFGEVKFTLPSQSDWLIGIHSGINIGTLINTKGNLKTEVTNGQSNFIQTVKINDLSLSSKRRLNAWIKFGLSYGSSRSVLFELNYFVSTNEIYDEGIDDSRRNSLFNEFGIRIPNTNSNYYQVSFSFPLFEK